MSWPSPLWSDGYVVETGYTFGYYPELNPIRLRLPLLLNNFVVPDVKCACELGYGQGLSINIHAATTNCAWYGTDFNASHAAFAQSLANVSKADCHLYDEPFSKFCRRDELPDFDFIGLHGIWSWISHENQREIINFILRKLKPGGVVYVSYNTQPGWASLMPLREMLCLLADNLSGPMDSRIRGAIEFCKKMFAVDTGFAKANPYAKMRFDRLENQDVHYLAHEYFNKDLYPVTFAEMAGTLADAKLEYACSAHWPDLIEMINLSSAQLKFLSEIKDKIIRETVRDFICNTQFRRDYWIKGPCDIDIFKRRQLIEQEKIVLLTPAENVELKIQGILLEGALSADVYKPVLEAISDRLPHSLGEITETVKKAALTPAQVVEAIVVLVGKGDAAPAVHIYEDDQALKLNRHIEELSRGKDNLGVLANPCIAGGMPTQRVHQLFALARNNGISTPEGWAKYVQELMTVNGMTISKNGRKIEQADEIEKLLLEMATSFQKLGLPSLIEWGVVPEAPETGAPS